MKYLRAFLLVAAIYFFFFLPFWIVPESWTQDNQGWVMAGYYLIYMLIVLALKRAHPGRII